MREMLAVFKRELRGYFATPLAYVFIIIFIFCTGAFAFYLGGYFEQGQANLKAFFDFHPWLYLFRVPAVAMRLWAEERRVGTIELLLSLPVPLWSAVLGKFLAAWIFIGIALALRRAGIGVELYPEAKRLGQQLKYADRRGFRFAVVIGDDEFASGDCQVKDLRSGESRTVSISDGFDALIRDIRERL